jgi:hypothetical protein
VFTPQLNNVARRLVLKASLVAIGGAVGAGAAQAVESIGAEDTPVSKPAQEKFTPEAVHYQPTPKDGQKYGQKCITCMHFEAPSTCKIVSGAVSPQGWCTAYALLHE